MGNNICTCMSRKNTSRIDPNYSQIPKEEYSKTTPKTQEEQSEEYNSNSKTPVMSRQLTPIPWSYPII